MREETRIAQGFQHYRGSDSPGVRLREVHYTAGRKRSRKTQMRESADVTSGGLRFIREHRSQPFFLWLHYFDVHSPYRAARNFRNKLPGNEYLAAVAGQDHSIGRIIEELRTLGLIEAQEGQCRHFVNYDRSTGG